MKLVIYLTTEARVRQCESGNPVEITPTWFGTDPVEDYGAIWARVWKDDIVMLVEEDA